MKKFRKKGFTLVEIMIVVAIIGLLAAIAIPNFVRARQVALKNACIANLKQIEGAIQVWAMDTGASETAIPSAASLADYIRKWPACGTTSYAETTSVGGVPVCPNSTTDHAL